MKWTNIKYCPLLCTKVRVQPICVFQLTYNLKKSAQAFFSQLVMLWAWTKPETLRSYVALYRPILSFFSLSFVLSTDFFVFSKLSQHQTLSSGSSTYTISSVHSSAMSWYVDYWQFKTLSPVYTTVYTDLLEKKLFFLSTAICTVQTLNNFTWISDVTAGTKFQVWLKKE